MSESSSIANLEVQECPLYSATMLDSAWYLSMQYNYHSSTHQSSSNQLTRQMPLCRTTPWEPGCSDNRCVLSTLENWYVRYVHTGIAATWAGESGVQTWPGNEVGTIWSLLDIAWEQGRFDLDMAWEWGQYHLQFGHGLWMRLVRFGYGLGIWGWYNLDMVWEYEVGGHGLGMRLVLFSDLT